MQLNVFHQTKYRFSKPLIDVIQLLRLSPLSCTSQSVLHWRIDVDCDARLREARDGYGNITNMLYVSRPVTELAITATGRIITEDRNGVVQGIPGDLPYEVFLRSTPLTQVDAALSELAREVAGREGTALGKLHFLNQALHQRMTFDGASTDSSTTAADAFANKRGVCQDFAHVFIAVARQAGLPARYVSGHLYRRDGDQRQSASHAWVEASVDELGWVAFDPSNGICADDAYVRIAIGLDYSEAAPVAGVRRGGGTEEMSVDVQVSSVTRRSQSQSQWQSGGGSQSQSQTQA
jgi:transglutaminase-like putative cysteine protease